MLTDFVRGASSAQILRSTTNSLRCIYILALGLRALVKKEIGETLSVAEVSALGSVRARSRDVGDETVSVYVGKAKDEEQLLPDPDQGPGGDILHSPQGEYSTLRPFPPLADENTQTPDTPNAAQLYAHESLPSTLPARRPHDVPPPEKVSILQRIRSMKMEISWRQYLLEKRMSESIPSSLAPPVAHGSQNDDSAPHIDRQPNVLKAAASEIMNIGNNSQL